MTRHICIASLAFLTLACAPVYAQSILNDGNDHVISDATYQNQELDVFHSPDPTVATPTSITLQAGSVLGPPDGVTYQNALNLHDDSTAQISGGHIFAAGGGWGIGAFDSSSLDIHGGEISGGEFTSGLVDLSLGSVKIYDSTVMVGNGSSALVAIAPGNLAIYGGNFSAGNAGAALNTFYMANVNIYGGTFTAGDQGVAVHSSGGGSINIYGGHFQVGANVDGFGAGLLVDSQPIDLYGQNFQYNVTSVDAYGNEFGTLTGTLANGDILNTTASVTSSFLSGGETAFIFHSASVVPEPGSVAFLAVTGVSGMAFLRRRRK